MRLFAPPPVVILGPVNLDKLRKDALSIFEAGVKAADPVTAVRNHLGRTGDALDVAGRKYDLSSFDNIYIIGMGKAAASMALAAEEVLGDRLTSGIVNVKYGHVAPIRRVRINEAGHPLPDDAGLSGTREIIDLLRSTGERDLVLCLISGGGSALLPMPAEGLALADKQGLTKALLECGATIHEINALRKHVSAVKGGRLARLAYPSTLVSLILSDVIGDDLDTIASGPTVPDGVTFEGCGEVIDKYALRGKIPAPVEAYIDKGIKGEAEETPKPGDRAFLKTQNVIVGSNILSALAAKEKAAELGYKSILLSTYIHGETEEVAKVHGAIAKEILRSGNPLGPPVCVVSGGETTVTIDGPGLGGRNQEFSLAAAIEIDGLDNVVILSGGTDGTDGPTDAAGAIADGSTVKRAEVLGLSAKASLAKNDSYNFFSPLGDLIITGPTNTNVMDLRLVLVG